MLNFIKKLFETKSDSNNLSLQNYSEELTTSKKPSNTGQYFETLAKLREAISKRKYEIAANLTIENLNQIPSLVKHLKQEHSFGITDISSIPALEHGGTILALLGMEKELIAMKDLVCSIPALKPWQNVVDKHLENISLFVLILEAIANNPGCQQTNVKKLTGYNDGRVVANLISWLEKAGKIIRTKKGRTHTLMLSSEHHSQTNLPKRQVKSHRTGKKLSKCQEIHFKDLPYIPLPRAPSSCECVKSKVLTKLKDPTNWFEIRETNQWKFTTIDKVPTHERPDTAFRRIHPIDTGILMVDDLGKSEICGISPVAVMFFGREGKKILEKPLLHDIYRLGVNPLGKGLIATSKECITHAYDDSFNLLLETSMRDFPEVIALQKRLNINNEQLKNHLRCIAMSSDNTRYLFTGVDEAWCIDIDGHCLWGVRLPLKEGWEKVSEPSEFVGTSEEVIDFFPNFGKAKI